jgi:hypothetical protein
MSQVHEAVVAIWHAEGSKESERRVSSLEELFEACKDAPPSKLVRITIQGPEGEVTLSFANFLRRS